MLDRRMIARPVAVGHRPDDVAFVQIDGGQPAVRRLEDRKPLRALELVAEEAVPAPGIPGFRSIRDPAA